MSTSLKELNKKRLPGYRKESEEENYLLNMNQALQSIEMLLYRNYPIEHPFLFVFGLPRSGTTLITQLIAHTFDIGYINNLIARFWLAPVHGIKLSKNIIGDQKQITFRSDYARTFHISDIHEFGYFWRYWLKKETLQDITCVREMEKNIDWAGLKKVLANIQHEFNKPMVFKNIFGSYHIQKLNEVIERVLFIYIKRDLCDVAVSILDARKKYYPDLNTWWSSIPIEYEQLKNLNYLEQIAGQVYFLTVLYERQIESLKDENYVLIDYEELCKNPRSIIMKIKQICQTKLDYSLKIYNQPPLEFPYRTYTNRNLEKEKFSQLLKKFEEKYRVNVIK